jgi:GTP-binding protein HflX
LFERPRSGERALLVRIGLGQPPSKDELSELESLAHSAGAEVLGLITGTRRAPDPRLFVGSGKAEEIHAAVKSLSADLVVFDHPLSPSQERNLEALLQCRVIDRTGLILDIFAQRARSFEGQLQVELAQLRHLATRLVRGWTHLERQKGGIGLRGPGETQLETDRRLLGNRIKTLNARLEKVLTQRETTRRERKRAEIPTVALVGYTNAGKSTLFNRMTGAVAYAANQLFATLDPTVRRLDLPDARFALLADTVGFVRDLPHELVAAFRSTLQEARESTLLLHIVDAADPERGERIEQVNRVLEEVGAGLLPQIEVYNKADLLGEVPRVEMTAEGGVRRVWVSAQTGAGIDLLIQAIADFLGPGLVHRHVVLQPAHGRARARFFAAGAVLAEQMLPSGETDLEISMPRQAFENLCRTEGLELSVDDSAQPCAPGEPFLQSRVPTRWFG